MLSNKNDKTMIDLRSDTVTKPCLAMRQAMFEAQVGDDVFGEDPSVNALESYVAQLFGKEAGLFCASGTQTNQIAIAVYCNPGSEVICHEDAHIYKYEGGGIARNAGASVRLMRGNDGMLSAEFVENNINPDNVHLPITALVSIEDTMNRAGGKVYPWETIAAIGDICRKYHLPLHLDGARIFNALTVNQMNPKDYAAPFDSISICLSKGLGAPVGSVLAGSQAFIHKARRVRKVFGGGMRQAGILAAAALYALKNNVARLTEDHRRAKELEKILTSSSWVERVWPVETNIIVVEIKSGRNKQDILDRLKDNGILAIDFGTNLIRFVTHLDIHDEDLAICASVFHSI
jgi:threonine aldolase